MAAKCFILAFTLEELASEEWRKVLGYEGLYSVSNLGRIKSERFNRLMKTDQPRRYLTVGLSKNGVKRTVKIHRLVADAFLGPRPLDKETNHKDTNKWNNRAVNFEYLTKAEHAKHTVAHGLMKESSRKNGRSPKEGAGFLTPEKVRIIREQYQPASTGSVGRKGLVTPNSTIDLAQRFGVSDALISMVVRRKIWTDVE